MTILLLDFILSTFLWEILSILQLPKARVGSGQNIVYEQSGRHVHLSQQITFTFKVPQRPPTQYQAPVAPPAVREPAVQRRPTQYQSPPPVIRDTATQYQAPSPVGPPVAGTKKRYGHRQFALDQTRGGDVKYHAQDDEGKNTQIIITLNHNPNAYLVNGDHKNSSRVAIQSDFLARKMAPILARKMA